MSSQTITFRFPFVLLHKQSSSRSSTWSHSLVQSSITSSLTVHLHNMLCSHEISLPRCGMMNAPPPRPSLLLERYFSQARALFQKYFYYALVHTAQEYLLSQAYLSKQWSISISEEYKPNTQKFTSLSDDAVQLVNRLGNTFVWQHKNGFLKREISTTITPVPIFSVLLKALFIINTETETPASFLK